MCEAPGVRVSVVYAEPGGVFAANLLLPEGSTVADAIQRSGIRKACPDIVIDSARLGIFARRVKPGAVLQDGDRVEIYRPLRVDPKEARRMRARSNAAR